MLFNIRLSNKKFPQWRERNIWLQRLLILLFLCTTICAQEKSSQKMFDLPLPKNVFLTEQDIADTINCFRTDDAKKSVETFKAKMPTNITDAKFREEIFQKLPPVVKQTRINSPEITESIRRIIAPVLKLYGKYEVYEIIVFQNQTPIMFSDSGVVLVVSTGMIERLKTDDELIGFAAHEVAHEYYAKASIYTKHILGFVTAETSDQALARKYWESLGLIELQCDSFSALTLAHLEYNPIAFIEGLERIERDYPKFVSGFHPLASVRRKVVEAIISTQNQREKPVKMSLELRRLKESIIVKQRTENSRN